VISRAEHISGSHRGVGRWSAYVQRAAPALTIGIIGLIGWQVWVSVSRVEVSIMASPAQVASTLWLSRQLLFEHAGPTVLHTIGGFLLSVVLGVGAAAVIVHLPIARSVLYPLAVALQVMPKEAIAPLLILWLGSGDLPRLLLAFLIAFFPIFVNALAGLQQVSDDLLRLVRLLRASQWQIFYQVRLPAAAPHIFSGMKISITLAVIGVVVAELVAGRRGLGYLLLFSAGRHDMASSLAVLAILAVVGLALYSLVLLAERLVVYWVDVG
jgi:NitT/TauT family transport system permease protein